VRRLKDCNRGATESGQCLFRSQEAGGVSAGRVPRVKAAVHPVMEFPARNAALALAAWDRPRVRIGDPEGRALLRHTAAAQELPLRAPPLRFPQAAGPNVAMATRT